MTDTFKVLAQSAPAAATETTLYTVPAATSTTISSIAVCNQNAAADTFSIRINVAGAATNAKQLVYSAVTVNGNDTFVATIGMTLATTDVVKVTSTNGTSSFNAFGVEIS